MADGTNGTTEKETWEDRFLDLLAATGNVTKAAKGARVGRTTVYRHREERSDFATRWKEAEELGVAALEDEARRRAFAGSDTLLIFLLKSHKPATYRETIRNEQSGPNGGPQVHEHHLVEQYREQLAHELAARAARRGAQEPDTEPDA